MTDAQAHLFALFDRLGIQTITHQHPAFFTVDEGRAYKAQMPGGHSKTLFVKDKKDQLFLVVAWADTQVDLNALSKEIAASRVSFASPDLMMEVLGVTPGSVTPFGLVHDRDRRVKQVVVDAALLAHDTVYFHPFVNTASTALTPDALIQFLKALGYSPLVRSLQRANVA